MAQPPLLTLEEVVDSFMNDPDSDDDQLGLGEEEGGATDIEDSDWEYDHVDEPDDVPIAGPSRKRLRSPSVSPILVI